MKLKIVAIIGIQISIIISSFLVLVYFENQSIFLGNSINISGKNRFLAEYLYSKLITNSFSADQKPLIDTITNVDDNIRVLSHGGILFDNSTISLGVDSGIKVAAVPIIFSSDLEQVTDKWAQYKSAAMNVINSKQEQSPQVNQDLEEKESQFIHVDNNLTYLLGTYSKEQVSNLILLQLLLLAINVIAHVLFLILILKISKQDFVRKLLLEQVSSNNKRLLSELRISSLHKDVLELFLSEIKIDMLKLEEQIIRIDDPLESKNNRRVFLEIMNNLSYKMKALASSKMELDDKISYYGKLNLQLAKSLSILSKSDNDNFDEIDVSLLIQSYIDSINLLVSNQDIPAHLGKRLTDTMYEIRDDLERLQSQK